MPVTLDDIEHDCFVLSNGERVWFPAPLNQIFKPAKPGVPFEDQDSWAIWVTRSVCLHRNYYPKGEGTLRGSVMNAIEFLGKQAVRLATTH